MNWRTKLPGARISETHASAIVVTRATTNAGSVEAHSASAHTNSTSTAADSASNVSATTKATAVETSTAETSTTVEPSSTTATVPGGPCCGTERDEGDAN